MEDTGLRYVDFDVEKTWDEMLRTYVECGGDILYPGDEKEMLLRAVLAIATAIMAKVDSALRMDTLTYATGEYLKEYGLKRNCAYIEATQATVPVKITFQPGGAQRTIPAGTELTVDGMIIYETTEDIQQTGGAQEITVIVQCQTPGTVGNGVTAGTQLQFVENTDTGVTAIAEQDASGGVDAEDEETYRERIRTYGLASVTTGPESLYESQALAVSAQIIDAKALNEGGGNVGIYLILPDDADQSTIFSSVQAALSAEDKRPLTDRVQVYAAAEVSYTISVKIWRNEFISLSASIEDTIAQYQAWQDNHIGRAFNPYKLISMLYQIGCSRVEFQEGSGIDGSMEYAEIQEREHCKGTITFEVENL